MTLNQYAASIANALKQPFNHELKERIKDLLKEKVAVYIRRGIDRHGIDDTILVSYTAKLTRVDPLNKPIEEDIKTTSYKLRTEFKVPRPIRYRGDSPFIYVGSDDRLMSLPMRNPVEHQLMHSYLSSGGFYSYYLANGYIFINDRPDNKFKSHYILIEGIWESPEQVLSMYDGVDGQDIQLPIPLDVMGLFREEILQLLGSIPPSDIRVEHNKEATQ